MSNIELRDYLAAQALNGFCSSNEAVENISMESRVHVLNPNFLSVDEYLASVCYRIADAMIRVRSNGMEGV